MWQWLKEVDIFVQEDHQEGEEKSPVHTRTNGLILAKFYLYGPYYHWIRGIPVCLLSNLSFPLLPKGSSFQLQYIRQTPLQLVLSSHHCLNTPTRQTWTTTSSQWSDFTIAKSQNSPEVLTAIISTAIPKMLKEYIWLKEPHILIYSVLPIMRSA